MNSSEAPSTNHQALYKLTLGTPGCSRKMGILHITCGQGQGNIGTRIRLTCKHGENSRSDSKAKSSDDMHCINTRSRQDPKTVRPQADLTANALSEAKVAAFHQCRCALVYRRRKHDLVTATLRIQRLNCASEPIEGRALQKPFNHYSCTSRDRSRT